MLVGEIGIERNLYLYRLQYWEIVLITRGYFRRYHPQWEMTRLVAHQTHYCMGLPKGETAKSPSEWLPFSWEQADRRANLPDEDEIEAMRREMESINAQQSHHDNEGGDTPGSGNMGKELEG